MAGEKIVQEYLLDTKKSVEAMVKLVDSINKLSSVLSKINNLTTQTTSKSNANTKALNSQEKAITSLTSKLEKANAKIEAFKQKQLNAKQASEEFQEKVEKFTRVASGKLNIKPTVDPAGLLKLREYEQQIAKLAAKSKISESNFNSLFAKIVQGNFKGIEENFVGLARAMERYVDSARKLKSSNIVIDPRVSSVAEKTNSFLTGLGNLSTESQAKVRLLSQGIGELASKYNIAAIKVEGLIAAIKRGDLASATAINPRFAEELQRVVLQTQKFISLDASIQQTAKAFNAIFQGSGQFSQKDQDKIKLMAQQLAILTANFGYTKEGAIQFYNELAKGDFTNFTKGTKQLGKAILELQSNLKRMDSKNLVAIAKQAVNVKNTFVKDFSSVATSTEGLKNKLIQLATSMSKLFEASGLTRNQFVGLYRSVQKGTEALNPLSRSHAELTAKMIKQMSVLKEIQAQNLRNIHATEAATQAEKEREKIFAEVTASTNKALREALPSIARGNQFNTAIHEAAQSLASLVSQGKLTKEQLEKMITESILGKATTYTDRLRQMYHEVSKVTSSLKQTREATQQWAYDAVKHIGAVNISWRSYFRYFITRTFYRAFLSTVTAMREGLATASDLQIKISEIRTISQNSAKGISEWAGELRNLSDAFPQSTLEIAEGAYQALSNQVADATTVTGFLTEALRLSITTLSTTKEAVNALSSVINSYNLGVGAAGEISAQLFKIVELGRVRLEEIADTLGNVTILAAQAGISFEEVGAALITLTRQGVTAATGMTLLRNVILKLLKPTEDMKDLMREWGAETPEQAIALLGFEKVLSKLEEATRGSATEIAELFGRIRASVGGAGLFSGDNLKTYKDSLNQLRDASDSYLEGTKRSFSSTARDLQIELQKVANFFTVDFGFKALDAINDVIKANGGLVNIVKTVVNPLTDALKTLVKVVNFVSPVVGFLTKAIANNAQMVVYWLVALKAWHVFMPKILKIIDSFRASVVLLTKAKNSAEAATRSSIVSNNMLAQEHKHLATTTAVATTNVKTFGNVLAFTKVKLASLKAAMATLLPSLTVLATLLAAGFVQSAVDKLVEKRQEELDNLKELIKLERELANRRKLLLEQAKEISKEASYLKTVEEGYRGINEKVLQYRANQLAIIDGSKALLEEMADDVKSAVKEFEDLNKVDLSGINSAISSTESSIKSLRKQLFDFNLQGPVGGFRGNIDAEAENLLKASKAYSDQGKKLLSLARKSADPDLYADAKAYFDDSSAALQSAFAVYNGAIKDLDTSKLETLTKELSKLSSNRYYADYSELLRNQEKEKELREQISEEEKRLTEEAANQERFQQQALIFQEKVRLAIVNRIELENNILAIQRAQGKELEAQRKAKESENKALGEAVNNALSIGDLSTATPEDTIASIQAAQKIIDDLKNQRQIVASKGIEGVAITPLISELIAASQDQLKALEGVKAATDVMNRGKEVQENLVKALDERKEIVNQIDQTLRGDLEGNLAIAKGLAERFDVNSEERRLLEGAISNIEANTGVALANVSTTNQSFINAYKQLIDLITNYQNSSAITAEATVDYIAQLEQSKMLIETAQTTTSQIQDLLSRTADIQGGIVDLASILGENIEGIDIAKLEELKRRFEDLLTSQERQKQPLEDIKNGLEAISSNTVQENLRKTASAILSMAKAQERLRAAQKSEVKEERLMLQTLSNPIIPPFVGFSSGGWVGGNGFGDTIPTMLTPGEFVVNKSAASSFAPILEAINSRKGTSYNNTTTNSGTINITINNSGAASGGLSQESARRVADIVRNDVNRGRIRSI